MGWDEWMVCVERIVGVCSVEQLIPPTTDIDGMCIDGGLGFCESTHLCDRPDASLLRGGVALSS